MSAITESGEVGEQLLAFKSDDYLIARLRARDDAGFDVIVDRYERELLRFCQRMLGSHEDAEDALQETFAAAYRAILADQRSINCRPWLYQIARNRCLNEIRRRRPEEPLNGYGEHREAPHGTAEEVLRRIELRHLVDGIQRLPRHQREALVLHELEGCSYAQIAAQLGTSIASVRSLLLRARRTLSAIEEARALPCTEVRAALEELDTVGTPVRRHLELCPDCAAYRRSLKRQPLRALRVVSPLGAWVAFKDLLRAHGAGAGTAGVAGSGTAASAGALSTAGAGVATKALAGLAVLALAGAGTVVVQRGATHASGHAAARDATGEPAIAPSPAITPPPTAATPANPTGQRASSPSTTTGAPTATAGQNAQTPASTTWSAGAFQSGTSSTPGIAQRRRPGPGGRTGTARSRPAPSGTEATAQPSNTATSSTGTAMQLSGSQTTGAAGAAGPSSQSGTGPTP